MGLRPERAYEQSAELDKSKKGFLRLLVILSVLVVLGFAVTIGLSLRPGAATGLTREMMWLPTNAVVDSFKVTDSQGSMQVRFHVPIPVGTRVFEPRTVMHSIIAKNSSASAKVKGTVRGLSLDEGWRSQNVEYERASNTFLYRLRIK